MEKKRTLKQINIRTFVRDYNNVLPVKSPTIITIKNTPLGIIYPPQKIKEEESSGKIDVKKLQKYFFSGGPKDLSERIDDILYKEPYE